MCGIFGLVVDMDAGYPPALIRNSLKTLARLSEARGKDSSGLVFRNESAQTLHVFKGAVPLRFLLNTPEVRGTLHRLSNGADPLRGEERSNLFAAMGHARLVTNGTHVNDGNNQPVIKDGVICIHNGIIVNADDLWSRSARIERCFEIDTEVMLALVRDRLRQGDDVAGAVSHSLRQIVGTASVAFLFDDHSAFAAATNNGSLYLLTDGTGFIAIASEEYFVRQVANGILGGPRQLSMRQVPPDGGLVVDLKRFELREFAVSRGTNGRSAPSKAPASFVIDVQPVRNGRPQRELVLDPAKMASSLRAREETALLEDHSAEIQALRRCTRCILPVTFPFIELDEEGVCNYCRYYQIRNNPKPLDQLIELVSRYKRTDGHPDCIVPLSGGRDSTFTLHLVKNVLQLKPITVTYDWGMVTDLARRNIARVCGKLGVENIIAAADISWKRENIRRNILAWLRNPDLGMIPLFMAGDKFFYYYVNKIKRQTGIQLNIWGINPLENTDFKVGFLGVAPDHGKTRIYSLSGRGQLQLLRGVGRNIARNSDYLNRSVFDTFGSFLSRYFIPNRDYYHLFDYYRWDESEIEELIAREYDWETAVDAASTWRVGDGTAAFYNYIYYTVAGFSECDTFRSNQIREGMMTREEALRRVAAENRPRYPTLRWYLDILGLGFKSTVHRINQIPKLYRSTNTPVEAAG